MIATSLRFTCMGLLLALLAQPVAAHPGAGILVDANGQVFFVDTGEPGRFRGFIWKVDAQGQLSAIYRRGGHWLALDAGGRFLKGTVGNRSGRKDRSQKPGARRQGNSPQMSTGKHGSFRHQRGTIQQGRRHAGPEAARPHA